MVRTAAFFPRTWIFLNFHKQIYIKHGTDMEFGPETNHDRKGIYKDKNFQQLHLDRKL